MLTCDGVIHVDCSASFCIHRQGIININRGSSIFSFRKRSRFDKMAEHFEYNHIPAQMSSINHFRVKSVLCYCDSMVVLHLTRNHSSQFGLLDLRVNKFLGVFGRQLMEMSNEELHGAISPNKTRCLIRVPRPGGRPRRPNQPQPGLLQLYELKTKKLLDELDVHDGGCHFAFDPRFTANRVAVTNFQPNQSNSLSIVQPSSWSVVHSNVHVSDTHSSLYPYLRNIAYTRDGRFITASLLDNACFCREKHTRNYQPIGCSIYVFNADTVETLHCIEYVRYTCAQHLCPINYTPVYSLCGSRMALVMDLQDLPSQHFVRVIKLPRVPNLQSFCRIVIRQNFAADKLIDLPLPVKLINYLYFKPEFDY